MQVKIKWIIVGASIASFCIGMTVQDKLDRRDIRKRKPLLVDAWSAVIVKAQEEGLTREEAKALIRNVISRLPYKFSIEDVSKIVDEEIEFIHIVR